MLTGCGGTGSPDDQETEQSPLSLYLNAVWGLDVSPEEQEKRFEQERAREEELVAQCMKDEGFEYTPNIPSGSSVALDASVHEPEDRDWVAQWGYGAVDSPLQQDGSVLAEEWVDPNADYVASLSESEQAAFHEALSGPSSPDEDVKYGAQRTGETPGCQAWAYGEVNGPDLAQSAEFAPLFEKINALYQEDPDTWPGIAELNSEWAGCMEAAGYPGFVNQMDAQASIYEKLDDASSSDPDDETAIDDAALKKIAGEEVELALVDLDCREQVSYRERHDQAQWMREDRFIADNKADLDALKNASEQAGS